MRLTSLHWILASCFMLSLSGCLLTNNSNENVAQHSRTIASSALTLETIYKDGHYRSDTIGQIRWLEDGSGYTAIEN